MKNEIINLKNKMNLITTAALFFLAAGILTSVSILSVYQILFTIPLVWYTYRAIKEKNFKLPVSAWFLLSFTLVALITLFINYDLLPKPGKNFGRLKYFLFGGLGIFVLRAWLSEASDKTKKFLTSVFFLSIVVAGVAAIYEYATGEDNRAKGLTDTMRYGYGSAMILLTLLSGILHRDKISSWFNWKAAIPVFLIGFVGMYLTYTRGALLGFLCGLPFVLSFYRPRLGLAFGALSVVSIGILAWFYFFGNVQQLQGNRFLMTKNNGGDQIRRSQWSAGIIAIKEKPVLGWGLSNFHSQLKRIKEENDLPMKDYNDAHSHNLFLEIGSGTGLIGLFFFFGWVIFWAIESFRKGGLHKIFIIPFGVTLFVSSQFEVTLDANNASMIFFLYAISSAEKTHV